MHRFYECCMVIEIRRKGENAFIFSPSNIINQLKGNLPGKWFDPIQKEGNPEWPIYSGFIVAFKNSTSTGSWTRVIEVISQSKIINWGTCPEKLPSDALSALVIPLLWRQKPKINSSSPTVFTDFLHTVLALGKYKLKWNGGKKNSLALFHWSVTFKI